MFCCLTASTARALLSMTDAEFGIHVLFYWLNHYPMKEGRKPEYPEKTPRGELQKMPHTKVVVC